MVKQPTGVPVKVCVIWILEPSPPPPQEVISPDLGCPSLSLGHSQTPKSTQKPPAHYCPTQCSLGPPYPHLHLRAYSCLGTCQGWALQECPSSSSLSSSYPPGSVGAVELSGHSQLSLLLASHAMPSDLPPWSETQRHGPGVTGTLVRVPPVSSVLQGTQWLPEACSIWRWTTLWPHGRGRCTYTLEVPWEQLRSVI